MEQQQQQQPSESDLLARLATNHLFLNQIEPFRATILALRSRNPDLACLILQTIVAKGGRYDCILFSTNSTPALLTYLCVIELLQFNDPVESVWKFDANALRLRAEFLLCVQIVVSRVRDRSSNLGQSDVNVAEIESVSNNELGDVVGTSVGENESNPSVSELKGDTKKLDYDMCLGVLNKVLEVGFRRLKPDLIESDLEVGESVVEIEEGEMMCLREVILENGDIFEALCENIVKQVKWNDGDGDLGDSPSVKEESRDEDVEVFKMIQRCVQTVHLDAMKECLKEGDEDGAVSRIQFLRFDCGVDEADYRMVLQDLLKRGLSGMTAYDDTWFSTRRKLLSVYEKALSSNSTQIVHMIQGGGESGGGGGTRRL